MERGKEQWQARNICHETHRERGEWNAIWLKKDNTAGRKQRRYKEQGCYNMRTRTDNKDNPQKNRSYNRPMYKQEM